MSNFKFQLLVLTYHRILPEAAPGAVAAKVFSRQLEYLQRRNWQFITTTELLDIWSGKTVPRGGKLVMLTFDDGWADNLFYADPLLREYCAKATIAVNTSLVNPAEVRRDQPGTIIPAKAALELAAYGRDTASFLTWNELAALRDSGRWDIQAHGHTHLGCYHELKKIKGFFPAKRHWTMEYALGEAPFPGAPLAKFASILSAPRTRLSRTLVDGLKQTSDESEWQRLCAECNTPVESLETEAEFAWRIRDDLTTCQRLLREKLQLNVRAMFWPWGHYSPEAVAAARDCGFEILLTMDKDAVSGPEQCWNLPRIAAPETFPHFRKQILVFSHPLLRRLRQWFRFAR